MKHNLNLEKIKVELEKMEDEIIKEREEKKAKPGSLFSYWLYEIKVKNRREKEKELTNQEKIKGYKEGLEEVVKQHQINMEDNIDRELCIKAVKDIHNAQMLIDSLDGEDEAAT